MRSTCNKIALNIDGDTKVSIKGFIAPIEYTLANYHVEYEWNALANLRVAAREKEYSASIFRAFLPDEAVSVGTPWQIEQTGALELLRQLHPNPHLDMRGYGDPGLWACLRAYTDEFADIVFRIHAEFKLGDGWFTPSQFTGHLIVNRPEETVSFFQMRVPEGPVNFEVGWQDEKSWDDCQLDYGYRFLPTNGTPCCARRYSARHHNSFGKRNEQVYRHYASGSRTCAQLPVLQIGADRLGLNGSGVGISTSTAETASCHFHRRPLDG